jgi:hypothetical protein
MDTVVLVAQDRPPFSVQDFPSPPFKAKFHLQMAFACTTLLIVDIVGCLLTHIQVPHLGSLFISVVVALAAMQFVPLYWHTKGKIDLRDAALTLPWAALMWATLPFPVDIAARLGMGVNLQGAHFAHIDGLLGVSVPAIVTWASHHWLGSLANRSYAMLAPLLAIAYLLPALTGRTKQAQQFLLANLLAFAIGLPFFAMLPAVGPWYLFHLAPTPLQVICQSDVLSIRQSALYLHHPSGIVCFPSFHVAWAILCVRALWTFRLCRVPVVILAVLIIFSTMSTGWHYFVDLLGGIALAAAAMVIAARFNR